MKKTPSPYAAIKEKWASMGLYGPGEKPPPVAPRYPYRGGGFAFGDDGNDLLLADGVFFLLLADGSSLLDLAA